MNLVTALLLATVSSGSGQPPTPDDDARRLYEEGVAAEAAGQHEVCVSRLRDAQKALGRAAVRIQAPLVRCLAAMSRWAAVAAEARVYLELQTNDALHEHHEIVAMQRVALEKLEEARLAEVARKQAETERLKRQRDKEAADRRAREERERRKREEAERRQRIADERDARDAEERRRYLADAPRRRDEHLAQAQELEDEAFGQSVTSVALTTVGAIGVLGGIGGGIGGMVYGATIEDGPTSGLVVLGSTLGGIGVTVLSGFCIMTGSRAGMEAERLGQAAAPLRDKAAQEESLIQAGTPE